MCKIKTHSKYRVLNIVKDMGSEVKKITYYMVEAIY